MKDFTVYLGKISEFDEFYKFFSKSLITQFPEYPPDTTTTKYLKEVFEHERFKKAIENHAKYFFIARSKQKNIIGYIVFGEDFGGVSNANWIAVDGKFQNMGIATRLVQLWEEFAKQHKSHALQIWTVERNRDFYKKRRFTEAGELPNFWFGIDHYLFYKHV